MWLKLNNHDRQLVVEPGFEPRLSGFRAWALNHKLHKIVIKHKAPQSLLTRPGELLGEGEGPAAL